MGYSDPAVGLGNGLVPFGSEDLEMRTSLGMLSVIKKSPENKTG